MGEISPLRRRMIEDMTIRNMSPATQRSYISAVSKFSRYFGRSPDKLTLDDVHAFQVHLVSTGISWPGLNQIVCALRFFYGVTLGEAAVPVRRLRYEGQIHSFLRFIGTLGDADRAIADVSAFLRSELQKG